MNELDETIKGAIKNLELRITINSLANRPHTIKGKRDLPATVPNKITQDHKAHSAKEVIDECCEAIEKLQIVRAFLHRTQKDRLIKILNNYGQFTIEELKTTLTHT